MRTWGGWQNIRFLLSFSLHLINLINNSYLLSVYCNCPHYTFRFHHILIRRIWPLDHNCPSASGNSLRSYEILWIPVTVTRSKLFVVCGNDSGYRRLTNSPPCHTNLSVLESYFIIALRSSPLNSPTPPFPLPFVLFLFSFSLLSNFFFFLYHFSGLWEFLASSIAGRFLLSIWVILISSLFVLFCLQIKMSSEEPWWKRELTGRKLLWHICWQALHWGVFAYGW